MNGQNDNTINPEVVDGTTVTKIKGTPIEVDTPSGAAWTRKYLHPPCATPAEYAGYPDANNSPSTDAEYKGLLDVATVFTSGTPPVVQQFDKVLILHTASAIAPVIIFKMDTTGTVAQLGSDVAFNRNINVQDMVAQNSSGRITYKSTTSWLNATAFNNQGNVTSAMFRPNVALYRAGDLFRHFDNVKDLRKREVLYRELHNFFLRDKPISPPNYVNSSSDSDFEVVERLQSVEHIERNARNNLEIANAKIQHAINGLKTSAAIDNFVQILQVGQIPFSPSQILMMSPNAVADRATQGSFVVQRFSQPEIMYKDFGANGINGTSVSNLKGMPCYILLLTSGATGQINAINVTGQPGNTTNILADLPWMDFLWGWTLYEGLSVAQAGSTAISSPPYVSIKTITGFEFQPLPDSMLSPFIRNCAVYDQSALRLATTTNHSIADSLPAAANFWGTLGSMLLKAAPTIIDTVSEIFGNKRTKEQKKTTNDTVKSLTSKLKSMESKLSSKPAKKSSPKKSSNTGKRAKPAKTAWHPPMVWSDANKVAPVPKPRRVRRPRTKTT